MAVAAKRLSIKSFLSLRVIKASLAVLLLSCIIINNFIPKNITNKEEITKVVGVVINNVIIKTIKDCQDTLTVMSNKITKDLYKMLRMGEAGANVPLNSGSKKEETPVNTSSDNGIISANRQIIKWEKSKSVSEKVVLSVGKIEEDLYRLYNNVKEYCSESNNIGILMFILFILLVIRRKDWEVINNIVKEEDKTNLC